MKKLIQRGTSLFLIVTILSLQAGCVDTAEIKRTINDSNQAVIDTVNAQNDEIFSAMDSAGTAAALGAIGVPEPTIAGDDIPADQAWISQVDRIERYISEHPEQIRTINALRIRQATILMQAQQDSLAKVAFEQVDPSQLFSDRDKAIHKLRTHLIWWTSRRDTTWNDADRESAGDAIEALTSVAEPLPKASLIRLWLEQIRVRIGIRLASATSSSPEKIREILSEATTHYAAQFRPMDQKLIQAWHENTLDEPDRDVLPMLRWYNYVPSAFALAESIWRQASGNTSGPLQFTPNWVACINNDELPCDPPSD